MISIIIPVYNGENVIRRAIENVIMQTYGDWELIVVNDGSSDSTEKILSEYNKNDKVTIITKKNGGVSSARNAGIEKAQGEYITFIDADDIIEENYLSQLSKGIGYDMVVTGFCYNDIPQVPNVCVKNVKTKEEIANNISEYLQTDNFCFPWARMFKMSIIKEWNIRFDEKLRFGEDHVFNWTYMCHIASLLIDTTTQYHKMSEENSGGGYKNLSFDEIDYLDKILFELKGELERYYNTSITPASKNLFHIMFMKDYISQHPCSFYAGYYRKYHPDATEKESYDFVAKSLYHPALHDVKHGRTSLEELSKFLDEPLRLFFRTNIKSRIIIPFIKLRMYNLATKTISLI